MKYDKYYSVIENLQKKYLFFLEKTKKLKATEEKNRAIQSLLELAVYHNVGIWTSSYIENFYTDLAKSIDIENYDIKYKPDSFLHVLTAGYETGGHTRVVERWIANAPETQSHSVVFITPEGADLRVLEHNVKQKNGECIYFDNELTQKEKALKLRKLGLHYEYVVLHTHMEDVIPIIAFGTEKFTRPVLFYNHASHMFWVGKSVADLVLDIIKDDNVTKTCKNIQNAFFMGVPTKEITYSKPNKKELRKKLGLPVGKKIIISSGSEQKYIIIGDTNYAQTILKLIDDDTYCYIIGIPKSNKYWREIEKKSNGHIKTLGYITQKEGYSDYLAAADLYIDSHPFGGGAALIDAISANVPALSLKLVYPQLDYLSKTESYCQNEEDFISKAKRILSDNGYAEEILKKLQNSLEEYQSKSAWNKRINELLQSAPKKHNVKNLANEQDYTAINDLSVFTNLLTDRHAFENKSIIKNIISQNFEDFKNYGVNYRKKGLPHVFEILSFKKGIVKTKVIKIFGLNVCVMLK